MRHNRHLFPNKLLDFVSTTFICFLILLSSFVQSCQPPTPGFQQFQDSSMTSTSYSSKCPDLILYPVNAVDTSDQYRFDYSDVSFGNTHSQGETVTISCTNSGDNTVQTVVEGYDQQRQPIGSSANLIATCTSVGGTRYTWTLQGRVLQFVDCR